MWQSNGGDTRTTHMEKMLRKKCMETCLICLLITIKCRCNAILLIFLDNLTRVSLTRNVVFKVENHPKTQFSVVLVVIINTISLYIILPVSLFIIEKTVLYVQYIKNFGMDVQCTLILVENTVLVSGVYRLPWSP
jgi:hypothetical protein